MILRKHSLVRVKRVFTIAAVDASDSYAELLITEPGTSGVRQVYSQDWPADKARYLEDDAAS